MGEVPGHKSKRDLSAGSFAPGAGRSGGLEEPEGLVCAGAEAISRAYPMLRQMAIAKARGSAMSPSSLAQETVCRLLRQPSPPSDENQVQAAAWQVMAWVLADRARSQGARERRERENGADGHANGLATGTGKEDRRLSRISEALTALAEQAPRKAEAMTLWALCGLPMERIAELLEVSVKTVQRDVEFARAWTASFLGDGRDSI